MLGSTFTATSLPGKPVLTVVGFANSITDTTDGGGWVTPGELSSLLHAGQPADGPAALPVHQRGDATRS